MKKLILFLSVVLVALSISAQDKVTSKDLKAGQDYWNFNLSASDTLTANMDTVDFKIKYVGNYVKKVALHIQADTIAGADTISVQLLGYDFADDASANVIIAADTTNVASSSNIILTDDYFSAADEFSFRYYVIRIIKIGLGDGVRFRTVEFKAYQD